MTNPTPLKIAVLVSGSGSNLQVLIDKQLQQLLNIQIVGVISNKADAYALERIRLANEQQVNIATAVIERDDNGKNIPVSVLNNRHCKNYARGNLIWWYWQDLCGF